MVGVEQGLVAEEAARELNRAREARLRGQEGRARVCARRAAGWAASAHYRHTTGSMPPHSALSLLKRLQQDGTIEVEIRNAAMRLTQRVTPTFEHPFPEDPLDDAQRIIDAFAAIRSQSVAGGSA